MNMGKTDRAIRAIVGVIAVVIAFLVDPAAWRIVLWVFGGIMLATAAIGFCPLYALLHISTKPKGS